jgi:hypothetical protein
LSNDVWRSTFIYDSVSCDMSFYNQLTPMEKLELNSSTSRGVVYSGWQRRYILRWEQVNSTDFSNASQGRSAARTASTAAADAFWWSPRAGHTLTSTSCYPNPLTDTSEQVVVPCLLLIGGFGGWAVGHPWHDEFRSRSDVWRSLDEGVSWQLLASTAPWPARAWHTALAWLPIADMLKGEVLPRIVVSGGGFLGQNGTMEITKVKGRVDDWWTRDGVVWYQPTHDEGSFIKNNLYSTAEWAWTTVDGSDACRGKYGHAAIVVPLTSDAMAASAGYPSLAAAKELASSASSAAAPTAMLIIGGDTTNDGSLENDVFISSAGQLCAAYGIFVGKGGLSDSSTTKSQSLASADCGGVGVCLSDGLGCQCPISAAGQFCTEQGAAQAGAAELWRGAPALAAAVAAIAMLL